jgi:hypothetical protein
VSIPGRKIVDALRNAGRAAEAERWAQRGLGIGNSIDKGKLRDVYVDLLLERGATDGAFALRWQLFDGNPIKTNYDDLCRTAERIGDWPGVRDKAVSRLRDATAGQPAYADHLIGVYLDEGTGQSVAGRGRPCRGPVRLTLAAAH